MGKVYKGYELMQAIAEGEIKSNQRVNSTDKTYIDCKIDFILKDNAKNIMNKDFELIENIREMNPKEIYFKDGTDIVNKIMYDKINEIIREVNKMQKEILEIYVDKSTKKLSDEFEKKIKYCKY